MLKSWSFSSLVEYEKCPQRLKLKYIDGIKIPPSEDPNHPLNRGTRQHSLIEDHIRFGNDLSECEAHKDYLVPFRTQFEAGLVIMEDEWGFDLDWNPVPWESATCRMKLDAGVTTEYSFHIYDWKTGKRQGNEIKHAHQGQLYAVGALARFPATESFTVTFRYLDLCQNVTQTYSPAQIMRFRESFNKRALKLLTDATLRPIANKHNCKYCDFSKHCVYAVE